MLKGRTVTLEAKVIDATYGFAGWYEGDAPLSGDAVYSFAAKRDMDIVARMRKVIHDTVFSRYTHHCNYDWDTVSPPLYSVSYVNGVRPKSVRFYYRVNNLGGDHGYLWTSPTWTCTGDQNCTYTANDANGQGGARVMTAAIRFYDTHFTLQGNIPISCREDFVGTMIYD